MILSGVYRIKNIITSDCYVGSSINIEKRWKQHRYDLKAHRHGNQKLQNSYNKHGADAFKFEILEICPLDLLIQREQEQLDSKAYAYNICLNAAAPMLGRKASAETKARLSTARLGNENANGNKNRLGKVHSAATKEKLSNIFKGIPKSAAAIARQKAGQKGRKFSAETKAKMSTAAKSRSKKTTSINNKEVI